MSIATLFLLFIIIALIATILPFGLIILFLSYLIYLLNFYNRKKSQQKIGASRLLDYSLTNKILSKKSTVRIGTKNEKFKEPLIAYEKAIKSNDIKFPEKTFKIDNISKNPFLKYNIICECKPLVMRFPRNKIRGLVFYVFPEIILALKRSVLLTQKITSN